MLLCSSQNADDLSFESLLKSCFPGSVNSTGLSSDFVVRRLPLSRLRLWESRNSEGVVANGAAGDGPVPYGSVRNRVGVSGSTEGYISRCKWLFKKYGKIANRDISMPSFSLSTNAKVPLLGRRYVFYRGSYLACVWSLGETKPRVVWRAQTGGGGRRSTTMMGVDGGHIQSDEMRSTQIHHLLCNVT